MGIIDIDNWRRMWTFILEHLPAVVLGLVIGITITVGLYQVILLPAQQARLEAVRGDRVDPASSTGEVKTNECLRKGIVVFIDGNGTYAGYSGEGEAISTADFLVEKARDDKGLGFVAKDAILPQKGKIDTSQIVEMRPDVVVVHRSTFDRVSHTPEERLVQLIGQLKSTSSIFLIYSRTPGSDGVYAAELARRTGTEGRVYSFQFRSGQPFKEEANVVNFLRYINTLARARVAIDLKTCP